VLKHKHARANTLANTRAYARTHTNTHAQTNTSTNRQTRLHTHTYARTCAHTHRVAILWGTHLKTCLFPSHPCVGLGLSLCNNPFSHRSCVCRSICLFVRLCLSQWSVSVSVQTLNLTLLPFPSHVICFPPILRK